MPQFGVEEGESSSGGIMAAIKVVQSGLKRLGEEWGERHFRLIEGR